MTLFIFMFCITFVVVPVITVVSQLKLHPDFTNNVLNGLWPVSGMQRPFRNIQTCQYPPGFLYLLLTMLWLLRQAEIHFLSALIEIYNPAVWPRLKPDMLQGLRCQRPFPTEGPRNKIKSIYLFPDCAKPISTVIYLVYVILQCPVLLCEQAWLSHLCIRIRLMFNILEQFGDILQVSVDHRTEDEVCYLKDIS